MFYVTLIHLGNQVNVYSLTQNCTRVIKYVQYHTCDRLNATKLRQTVILDIASDMH